MRTLSKAPFEEVKDPEARVSQELFRTFENTKNRDRLIDRHLRNTVGAGWVPLSLRFDERVSAYHIPAIGETKAVAALNLGCEGSALTASNVINAARENGIAFLAFNLVTRDAAGGDTQEQLRASIAANAWANISTMSPLHQLYDTEKTPAFLIAQSSACAMTVQNMMHEGFANKANGIFQHMHFVVPFFDASTAGTAYPLDHLATRSQRIFANAVRNTRNAVWAAHANILGNGQLGHGLDRLVVGGKAPAVRMPTRKEGRTLQLYARNVLRDLEGLPADHPLFEMPMTSWMSPNDEASCPHSARYFSQLVGADVRTDQFRHMNLKKRLNWVAADIQTELGEPTDVRDMPRLTSFPKRRQTVEDIVRQTGGVDPDIYESPIRPTMALVM